MFTKGQKWGMCSDNPVRLVDPLPEKPFNPVVLNAEQQNRLIAAAPKYIQDLLIFDFNTGLRKSDLFGLKWETVDMERRKLRIIMQKTQTVHEMPLNARAMEVLQRQKRVSQYVFMNPLTGRRIKDVRVALGNALKAAGLPHLSWHACRHSIATMLLEVTDARTAQLVLGHRSHNTIIKYLHPADERLTNSMERLAELQSGVSRQQSGVSVAAQNSNVLAAGHNLVTVPANEAGSDAVVH